MRRAIGLVSAVLCVLGLTTAAAHAAARRSPGRVHRLHAVSHSSVSVSLSWRLPSAKAFRSTVIRYAAGTRAPRSVHGGRSAAHLGRTRNTLTVGGLRSGASYAFSVFALDAGKHAGPRVSIVAAVAPAAETAVSTFATVSSTDLTWVNPTTRSFSRVVVRLAKGAAAPTGPFRGRSVKVASARATSARLTGLARNTTYAVSVWAFDRAGGRSTPGVARFTTSAGPDPDGTLTGVVRDTAGHGLANAQVSLFGDGTGTSNVTVTSPDGQFRLSEPADDYTVFISGDRITGGISATGYVGTVVDATVASGRGMTLPAITLDAGAAITGRVVDAQGNPVAGVYPYAAAVNRFVTPDDDGLSFLSSYAAEGSQPTTAEGTFVLRGVQTDAAVRFCADPTDDEHTAACAERTLLLSAGSTQAVPDLVLGTGQGGTISGTVRGSDGTTQSDAYVSLEGDTSADEDLSFYQVTDSAGRFELDGVPAGSYHVCAQSSTVSSAHPTGFAPACSARTTTVSAGSHTLLDVSLPVGAALTGTITGPNGHPVAQADVAVQSEDTGATTRTNSHGQYTITALAPGSVTVCVSTSGAVTTGAPTGVQPACWRHGGKLTLSAGRERSGVDLALVRGGAVSGTVLAADGTPAAGVQVSTENDDDEDGDGDDYGFGSFALTDAAGHYTVRGLPAGSYDVCFDALTATGTDQSSCSPSTAKVTVGHTVTGVNTRIAPESAIKVTVHDSGGLPVAGVDAAALASCPDDCDPQPLFDPKAGVSIDASQTTDGTGVALLDGITPGSYAVCLYAFNGTTSAGGAATGYADRCSGATFNVTVTRGHTTAITLVLPDGGAVSGTITDAGHHPIAGVRALVSQSAGTDYVADDDDFDDDDAEDSPVNFGYSAADGTYTAIGVQPGARTVCFDATDATGGASLAGYRDGCLGAAPGSTTGGTAVTVKVDEVTSGTDITLAAAGGISGTVRHGTAALPDAEVVVFGGTNVHDVLAYTGTDAAGHYEIDGLTPGSGVTVCFLGKSVHSQCWRNVAWTSNDPPLDQATLITVPTATVVPGVDATLQ